MAVNPFDIALKMLGINRETLDTMGKEVISRASAELQAKFNAQMVEINQRFDALEMIIMREHGDFIPTHLKNGLYIQHDTDKE